MPRSDAAFLVLCLSFTLVGCSSRSASVSSPPSAATAPPPTWVDTSLRGSHRWVGKAFDGEYSTDVTIFTEDAAVVSAVFYVDLFCGDTKETPRSTFAGARANIEPSAGEGRLTGPPTFTFEGSANTACGVRNITVTGYLSSPTTLNGFAAIKPPPNPERPFVARPVRWNADMQ